MKRFFCAAFFVVVVALLAACGALNTSSAAAQATATPTSSTSRTQKSDSTVKVNETAAKVEVVTAQSSATPSATAGRSTSRRTLNAAVSRLQMLLSGTSTRIVPTMNMVSAELQLPMYFTVLSTTDGSRTCVIMQSSPK